MKKTYKKICQKVLDIGRLLRFARNDGLPARGSLKRSGSAKLTEFLEMAIPRGFAFEATTYISLNTSVE